MWHWRKRAAARRPLNSTRPLRKTCSVEYPWLGRPGGFLPQGSHRPGRADFPHPVPQMTVLLNDKWSARLAPVAKERHRVVGTSGTTLPWPSTTDDSTIAARPG